jgi:hypothetical protein
MECLAVKRRVRIRSRSYLPCDFVERENGAEDGPARWARWHAPRHLLEDQQPELLGRVGGICFARPGFLADAGNRPDDRRRPDLL